MFRSLLILPFIVFIFLSQFDPVSARIQSGQQSLYKDLEGGIREPEKWSLTTLPKAQFVACWKSQGAKQTWPLWWGQLEEEDRLNRDCGVWEAVPVEVTTALDQVCGHNLLRGRAFALFHLLNLTPAPSLVNCPLKQHRGRDSENKLTIN